MTDATASGRVRIDPVVEGIWRLRLPLPWAGLPYVNTYAIRAEGGFLLVDTGVHEPGALDRLDGLLAEIGGSVADLRGVVVTHAHADHMGMAEPLAEAAGCPIFMHPNLDHARGTTDPVEAFEERLRAARRLGVPEEILTSHQRSFKPLQTMASLPEPDVQLVRGVSLPSDVGAWEVHETPGHAPSHVVLHEPRTGALITGDVLLGRPSLFLQPFVSEDPLGDYLSGLDEIAGLAVSLCLPGHGRPFRDVQAALRSHRAAATESLESVAGALDGTERSAFDIAGAAFPERLSPDTALWTLTMVHNYLCHLRRDGLSHLVPPREGTVERWTRPDRAERLRD